jgi:hypothetical protein
VPSTSTIADAREDKEVQMDIPIYSYLPIDVGFDLRRQRMATCLPPDEPQGARYATRVDNTREVTGSREVVARTLRANGYRVDLGNPAPAGGPAPAPDEDLDIVAHRDEPATPIRRRLPRRPGECREILRIAVETGLPVYCLAPAVDVRLSCPAGRPDAHACYCDAHGGEIRAQAEAGRDWNYLAPESVGDEGAVQKTGCESLCSEHVYLVLRERPPETRPEQWRVSISHEQRERLRILLASHGLAWHGLNRRERAELLGRLSEAFPAARAATGWPSHGSLYPLLCLVELADHGAVLLRAAGATQIVTAVVEDAGLTAPTVTHLSGGVHAHPRPWTAHLGVGSHMVPVRGLPWPGGSYIYVSAGSRTIGAVRPRDAVGSWATRDEALAAGMEAWRLEVDERVREITEARGGTLEWGIPISPRETPIVVEPRPGETSWDAAAAAADRGSRMPKGRRRGT